MSTGSQLNPDRSGLALDDPVKLARAAQIIRLALQRRAQRELAEATTVPTGVVAGRHEAGGRAVA